MDRTWTREQAIAELIKYDMNHILVPAEIKFHCDGCASVCTCPFAYEPYNSYDGGLHDTGCLAEK